MMPEPGAFRQVDEKHVSAEVDLMVWSPKFDLVALSNVQGEVAKKSTCTCTVLVLISTYSTLCTWKHCDILFEYAFY